MSHPCSRLALLGLVATLILSGCRRDGADAAALDADAGAVAVSVATAVEEPITRFIRVSGTLVAQEKAEVAAEIAGRVEATPIERGSRVAAAAQLIRISASEVSAQATEAQANVAQIEARLGIASGEVFDVDRVPEVANARAGRELALTELSRARMLKDQKLLSAADFDQREAQANAAARQYDTGRNGALQQYQSLQAARARAALTQKAVADAVVRSPFAGAVAERLVSVGDYVTRGTKVATVIRVDPLRMELTVPAQFVAEVAAGRAVTFMVDTYPDETFTGIIRYVSPAINADSRALVVEALVPNTDGRLMPGFFATARIEEASRRPALLIPSAAVRMSGGAARVFVVTQGDSGRRAEERVIAVGQVVGDRTEVASGLTAGEQVVVDGIDRVVDGVRLAVGK
mgnify:CR=1 FL=1